MCAADDNMSIQWFTLSPDDVEGKGWKDTERPFDRMPAKSKDVLPDVWGNSHSSTGMCCFFETDSANIKIRTGLECAIGEPNFNAAAHSGTDLYAYDESENRWRWAAAAPHFALTGNKPEYFLLDNLSRKMRKYRLYLPLRNQLSSFEIGVDSTAEFRMLPPRKELPMVYYGTSIIHGAYSVRSGLCLTSRLGRALDIPVINLGFSGAARMEKEMACLLAELDARMYVADPFHNINSQIAARNTESFIETLCGARPDTPVFMVSAPKLLNCWLYPEVQKEQDSCKEIYEGACLRMMKKYANLHYIDGADFYGGEEVSMDGCHPNDAAFEHMAQILEREIRKVISL